MRTTFTRKEHSDSGLALILLLILLFLLIGWKLFIFSAILVVLINMLYVPIVYPFTFIWLNISHYMGSIMSKVILAFIFAIFLAPVAIIRKSLGKDSLKINQFKKSSDSVFVTRNHAYSKQDIENPY